MKILKPNTGENIVPISKNNVYVNVMDFGVKFLLKEIKVAPGQHTFYWVPLKADKIIDISDIDFYICSFDHAINKMVNNAYCTVYSFDNFEEMVKMWNDIKYIDNIATVYKDLDGVK